MSYQAIARRWRSLTFEELVGQEHVTVTLRNALASDRLHHALLFTGPRGTGKTSSARILAKSLRCPNAKDWVPCNQCPSCEDINLGRSVDVIEIDGASNNGVDSIRELRESVGFRPSSGSKKVYIIDEVHMLSTSAFNALLKTLEEPPEHVLFIMATTEVHKIPATILSRCQRFDFRRISTRVIADRLGLICQTDGFKCEEDALWILARQGDGSMRDAQSLLDQVITFSGGELTVPQVVSILGLTDHEMLKIALEAIGDRDAEKMLGVFQRMDQAGVDYELFIENLLEHLRHLSMVKIFSAENLPAIDLSDSELRFLRDLSAKLEGPEIHLLFDMALKGASDLRRASQPRWVLEMLLLRLVTAPKWVDIQNVLKGQAVAAAPLASPKTPTTMPSASVAAKSTANLNSTGSSKSRDAMAAKPASTAAKEAAAEPRGFRADMSPTEKWFEFVQKIKRRDPLFGAKIEPLFFVSLEESLLSLAVPPKMSFLRDQLSLQENREKLEALLESVWGQKLKVEVQLKAEMGTSAKSIAIEKEKKAEEDLLEKVSQNPKVMTFNKIFKGKVQGLALKKSSDDSTH